MQHQQHEDSYLFSSDPANGALNVSNGGGSFEVELQSSLVPAEAKQAFLSVESATVWWTVANIVTGTNDTFYITYDDGLGGGPVTYDVTVDQGLYDLTALNTAVVNGLIVQGLPSDFLALSANFSTQKVEIRCNYMTTVIDFTQADTFRDILGYGSVTLTTASVPQIDTGASVAAFNTINNFEIHSDITNTGMAKNGTYTQQIAEVLIDVSPGSQIVHQPFRPVNINVRELIGSRRRRFRFWLTDQTSSTVNTSSEYWTVRVAIRYSL